MLIRFDGIDGGIGVLAAILGDDMRLIGLTGLLW